MTGDRPPALLLIGSTGSGKTPLGNLLEARGLADRPCVHFDFGHRLRETAVRGASAGALGDGDVAFLRRVLREGLLLENENFYIAEAILRAFLAGKRVSDDAIVVLNGLPRHVDQARDVDAIVRVDALVYLSCTPEVTLERIHSNVAGDRAQRTDDDVESVRERIERFTCRTLPLLEHYAERGARVETVTLTAASTAEDLWRELGNRWE